jgi:hypothetical protein
MYAGRPGYGGKLPYAGLGVRTNAPFFLAGDNRDTGDDDSPYSLMGVGPNGRGPYLGDFFNDVAGVAGKISAVAGKVSDVVTGKSTVATVPTGYSSFTLPIAGGYSQTIPLWVLGAGAGALILLAMRKRR